MFRRLFFAPFLLAAAVSSAGAQADCIEAHRTLFSDGTSWTARIEHKAQGDRLLIIEANNQLLLAYAFHSFALRLCSETDENYEHIGIFSFEIGPGEFGPSETGSGRKLIVLSGHSGAHSQKTLVFEPHLQQEPVVEVSGEHSVTFEIKGSTLMLTADRGPEKYVTVVWPPKETR